MAQKISDANLVISLSQRPNGFNARVAAQRGRLIQLDITLSPGQVHNKCSCGVTGSPCEHAAAALLTWEKKFPDSAKLFLETKEEDLIPEAQGPLVISRSSTPSLESLLINMQQKKAGLYIQAEKINDTLFSVEIDITYEKRKFSSTNFKSLTSTGKGPANLTIDHFDIDDREIMNLLAELPKEGRIWKIKATLLNRILKLRRKKSFNSMVKNSILLIKNYRRDFVVYLKIVASILSLHLG